jgi:hypothetical protein
MRLLLGVIAAVALLLISPIFSDWVTMPSEPVEWSERGSQNSSVIGTRFALFSLVNDFTGCFVNDCGTQNEFNRTLCGGKCNESHMPICMNQNRSRSHPCEISQLSRTEIPPRFAICFWGVNRALPLTINSIERHIFRPLKEKKVPTDTFFHTYSLTHVTSKWANEVRSPIPGAENELSMLSKFSLTRYEVTDQSLFDRGIFANVSNIFPRSEYVPEVSLNALRALYSLLKVTELWDLETSMHGPKYYRGVLYFRPDLTYISTLKVAELLSLGDLDFLTPIYDHYGGVNDRLCACGVSAARAFGSRILLASEYGKNNTFRSERLNLWALSKAEVNITSGFAVCGQRTRSDGIKSLKDCTKASPFLHHRNFSFRI